MAQKKRSYTERMKYEKRKQEREIAERKRRNRNIIIAILAVVVAVGVIVGAVFGIKAIVDAKRDRSEYADSWDTTEHNIAYAEIKVKGYDEPIKVLLDATVAPKTVKNFVELAQSGFYDGLTFHRVIENFMIQGGDPKADGTGGNTDEKGNKITIDGEFSSNGFENNMKHLRGVISMARGDDKNSASSQFFICNADYPSLDGQYAAFGYVIEGMLTVDAITEDTAGYGNSNGTISDKSKQAVIEYIKITGYSDIQLDPNETEEDLFT